MTERPFSAPPPHGSRSFPSQAVYLLPGYPPLALLAAWAWQTAAGPCCRWGIVPLGAGVASVVATAAFAILWPEHVDEAVFHRVRYVLAAVPPRAVPSPR